MCAGLRKGMLGFLLMLLLLLPLGGVCKDYGVNYPQASICAVENSTVFIPCTYFYPRTLKVVQVMWGHERSDIYEGPFLFDSNDTLSDPRFQYRGDRQGNCSLTIAHVGRNDSGKYTFRFVTDYDSGKFTGVEGSTLAVAGLSVSPTTIGQTKEGDVVSLTCQSGCSGAQDSFTWFKDGVFLRDGPVLNLNPVSPSDSGSYSCSLSVHPGTTSGDILVDVEHGPKDTSAGLPMEADGGRIVSLVCSSRANPPVQSYVWFRVRDGVQEVGNQAVLDTAEEGEYFCSATNKYGSQNSSAVSVRIRGNGPQAAYVAIAVAVVLIVIAVVVAVRFKRTTKRAPEEEDRRGVQRDSDASQSAKTSQEGKTAETTDVIYTSVQFASSRGQQKELTNDDVIYSTLRV